jgi:hypothetical protein
MATWTTFSALNIGSKIAATGHTVGEVGMPRRKTSLPDLPEPSAIELRRLTEEEIEQLETTLGKPVDRKFLVYWFLQAARDVVRISVAPAVQEYRDNLLQIAAEGHQWCAKIEGSSTRELLSQNTQLNSLLATVANYCADVEVLAARVDEAIKPGPRTPLALEVFIDKMIGIAKVASVLPSTPSRDEHTSGRPPPAFFGFTKFSLDLARDLIRSSPLSEDQRKAASRSLYVHSDAALGKLLERLRGKIGNYRKTPHGLSEWPEPEKPHGSK